MGCYRLKVTTAGPDPDASRRIGQRAFNKAKSFFEDQNMIFDKIDQENDIGIDAILRVRRGPDAGLFVNVQVKGGDKYKRASHIDQIYSKRGMASLRSGDWMLWPAVEAPRGYEGHHWVDVDTRLKTVWHNARPTYVLVQDPDDEELYFGNLTRMVDMQPLDQDLAKVYERMGKPDDGSPFHTYLAKVHARLAGLPDDKQNQHKTMMPLYPDLQLTPDGLDRFMRYALADARRPLPAPQSPIGKTEIQVRYPDGTIGPSLEALEIQKRHLDQELRRSTAAHVVTPMRSWPLRRHVHQRERQ